MSDGATFKDTLRISLEEAGGEVYIPPPLPITPKELALIARVDLTLTKTIAVVNEKLTNGTFNYDTASKLEKTVYDELERTGKINAKNNAAIKSIQDREVLNADRRKAGVTNKKFELGILNRRVPFFITTEVFEQNALNGFENIQARIGRYSLHYKGGEISQALKRRGALPLEGRAGGGNNDKGKHFVIRNIRSGNAPDEVIVDVDLNENPIPLIILGGAVLTSALGAGGWFLHKAERVLSSPLLYLAVIGLFILLFTGKLGGK